MIFISAQPDGIYFIWQLELQLRNFLSLGIPKDKIHVLIAFNKDLGLDARFKKFISNNAHLASFFIYEDMRIDPKYLSSVRPHILKQHFEILPSLENETLFYHDSDILLSRIPNIGSDVIINDISYVSDTRSYLNVNYIRDVGSEQLLNDMLKIVGLSKEILENRNDQTGGAQYIIKGITSSFWEKVEIDSEKLYVLMNDYNTKIWETEFKSKKEFRSAKGGIQAWCADMWALLWNLWLIDRKVKIHKEMDFSLPYDKIDEWKNKAILHYSGKINDKSLYFDKFEYYNYLPWYDNSLKSIPDNNCSFEIVNQITQRRQELDKARPIFSHILLLLKTDVLDDNCFRVCEINKTYIQKYYNISICIISSKTNPKEDTIDNYNLFLIMPYNLLLGVEDLKEILLKVNPNNIIMIDKKYIVDSLFSEAFLKMLDIDLLILNKGKFNQISQGNDLLILDREYMKQYFNEPNFNMKSHLKFKEGYLLT